MAFYENKVEHFDGSLVLFQRNLAVAVPNSKTHRKPTWYMRLKIGGRKGYITRSTKLTIYEDAYEFAKLQSQILKLFVNPRYKPTHSIPEKKELKVLFIGVEESGKTTLLYGLFQDE